MESAGTTKNLFILWIVVLILGFGAMAWYKQQPGPVGKIQSHWPQNVSQPLNPFRHNLVLFAHPGCSCTYASIVELEKLLVSHKNKFNVQIYFYYPSDKTKEWTNSTSKTYALKLPNTEVIDDRGGEFARRFGALTSGQAILYSPEGKLVFAGGLTETRGHIGESEGTRSIASAIETGQSLIKSTSTFGCILFSEIEMNKYKKEYSGK